MIEDIFKKFGEDILKDMQSKIPKASGRTADSLELIVSPTGFEIKGDAHIQALVDGRKPTSSGAKAGNPTLREQILDWIKTKGITPNEPSMSQESLAFVIARSIHENGYKGKKDMFKGVLSDNIIKQIEDSILLSKSTEITSSIIKIK